jgi:anti-sigma regulatory factor (Ser/Thr protein kinase)
METVAETALRISETVSASIVGTLRRRAAAAIADVGAPDTTVDAVRLCVSEALANSAMHAYPDQAGVVEVIVEVEDEGFVVTVRDYGRGIGRTPGARVEEGGMGLEIIRTLTERYRITSESGSGTEICMFFARPSGADSLVPPL